METQMIICSNCQTPNPAKNLFCLSCGKPLGVSAPVYDQTGQPIPVVAPPPTYTQIPASQPAPAQRQGFPPQGFDPQQNAPGMPQPGLPPKGFSPQQNVPGMPQPGLPPQGFQQQNAAPPQGYYPPPPLIPVPMAPSLERFGVRKEDWLRLISGRADAAEIIKETFADELLSRGIPMVTVEKVDLSAGFSKKPFQLVRHPAGSVMVAVDPLGKDLSMSWALYVPQVPKWTMLGILAGIAFAVSFLTSLNMAGNFGYFFVSWVFGTFRWLLDVAILALIAGHVWKGSWWYFFIDTPNQIARETLNALKLAVQQALVAAAEKAGIDSKAL